MMASAKSLFLQELSSHYKMAPDKVLGLFHLDTPLLDAPSFAASESSPAKHTGLR
jgi:hypothetical protein